MRARRILRGILIGGLGLGALFGFCYGASWVQSLPLAARVENNEVVTQLIAMESHAQGEEIKENAEKIEEVNQRVDAVTIVSNRNFRDLDKRINKLDKKIEENKNSIRNLRLYLHSAITLINTNFKSLEKYIQHVHDLTRALINWKLDHEEAFEKIKNWMDSHEDWSTWFDSHVAREFVRVQDLNEEQRKELKALRVEVNKVGGDIKTVKSLLELLRTIKEFYDLETTIIWFQGQAKKWFDDKHKELLEKVSKLENDIKQLKASHGKK